MPTNIEPNNSFFTMHPFSWKEDGVRKSLSSTTQIFVSAASGFIGIFTAGIGGVGFLLLCSKFLREREIKKIMHNETALKNLNTNPLQNKNNPPPTPEKNREIPTSNEKDGGKVQPPPQNGAKTPDIQNKDDSIVNPSINQIVPYPGDLSAEEKEKIQCEMIDTHHMKINFLNQPGFSVTIRREDIFTSGASVIVNAANTHLGGGGGIDGAIRRRGGPSYAQNHKALKDKYKGTFAEGYAEIIKSGELEVKDNINHVIVVAGPATSKPSKQDETALYNCYYNSLKLAHDNGKTSIAFPSISTGIFNFPKDVAARVSTKAINQFISSFPETSVKTISIHFLPTEPASVFEDYIPK